MDFGGADSIEKVAGDERFRLIEDGDDGPKDAGDKVIVTIESEDQEALNSPEGKKFAYAQRLKLGYEHAGIEEVHACAIATGDGKFRKSYRITRGIS